MAYNNIQKIAQYPNKSAVNVLDYIPPEYHAGIKAGTNTTDLSGYIQSAIDVGGSIYFPKGTYFCNNLTTFDAGLFDGVFNITSSCIIYGDGADTIFTEDKTKGSAGNGYALFVIRGADNVTIKDIKIVGSNHTTNYGLGSAVTLRPVSGTVCSNITLQNLIIDEMRSTAINSQSITGTVDVASNVLIDGCSITNTNYHGIGLSYTDNLRVTNNYIYSTGIVATTNGLGVDVSNESNNCVVSNNHIINCQAGVKAELNGKVIISDNTIIGGANSELYGIRVSGDDVIVTNNIIDAMATGIDHNYIDTKRTLISNNIFTNITDLGDATYIGYAARIQSSDASSTETKYCIVSNNIFDTCAEQFMLRASGISIEGNVFKDITNHFQVDNEQNAYSTDTYNNLIIYNNNFINTDVIFGNKNEGAVGYQSNNVTFTNNKMENGQLLFEVGLADSIISNNIIYNESAAGNYLDDGISISGGTVATLYFDNVIISNNHIDAYRYGLNINCTAGNGLSVTGNIITSRNNQYGITMAAGTATKVLATSNITNSSAGNNINVAYTTANNI